MKLFNKCLAILVFLLSISTASYAGGGLNGSLTQVFSNVAIAGSGATVTSIAFPIQAGQHFGVWYQASTTNNGGQSNQKPNLRINYQMGYAATPLSIFALPGTTNSFGNIETSLSATTPQTVSITPPAMGYLMIRAAGNSGSSPNTNSDTTTLNFYLFRQE